MNNSTVAHEWANQTREGRRGSNFYFEGPRLYSYGAHFVVGVIADTKAGRCALFNSRRYSQSTAIHQSRARGAASHLIRFTVPAPGTTKEDIKANCLYYLTAITEAQGALIRARVNVAGRENVLSATIGEAARYTNCFPRAPIALRRKISAWCKRLESDTLVTADERTALEARRVKQLAREIAATKHAEERRAALVIEATVKLEAWTNGEAVTVPYIYELPTRLRLNATGAAVETSRGAVVSVRAARIAWAAIKSGRDIVGMVLDGYTVTAFNGVLKIGCHTIERAEVERIGALIDGLAGGESPAAPAEGGEKQ